jgi:hypothetical protein
MQVDQELVSALAGGALSLAFSYIPGVAPWFDEKGGVEKRGIMGLLLIAVTLVIFGLSCVGWYVEPAYCSESGAQDVLKALVWACVANQAAYVASGKNKQDAE